jgi:type IV pilus assembly protein PilM
MGFTMFSAQTSPIAIDFGSASVKMLQIHAGEKPQLIAAAEIPVPDAVRLDPEKLHEFYEQALPRALREGRFRGRRAVCAIPSSQTFIQHMPLSPMDGVSRDDLIKGQLQTQMGCPPSGIVVRAVDVGEVNRNGQAQQETICFAIGRDVVMRYVELLKRCRLELVGVHTQVISMVRAFDHLYRRKSDESLTTLFADLGWGGTSVGITHGRQLVFARYISIGGRTFDQHVAEARRCDLASARAHRLSLAGTDIAESFAADRTAGETSEPCNDGASAAAHQVGRAPAGPGDRAAGAAVAAERRRSREPRELSAQVSPASRPAFGSAINLDELIDTISDELSMCLRYHQGLFRGRLIDRAVLLGGESRQAWLCQHLVKALRLPAQIGDPLSRLATDEATSTPGLKLDRPHPEWAVACGLCTAPTDL